MARYTFLNQLKSCSARETDAKGSSAHSMLCTFIDKYGQRLAAGFEVFARLCCTNAKDEISDVALERLIFETPNREMQLLFGQLGAVSLIGSLIQTLEFVWKVRISTCVISSPV
jgi:hypothetical protein